MKKWLICLLCFSFALAELDLDNLSFSIDTPPTGNPIRTLSLETLTDIEIEPPFEYALDSAYAPGQTVTINVQKTRANVNITAISAIIQGEKIELREYTKDDWTAYYQLPADIKEGSLPVKIYLRGPDFAADEITEITVAYPLTEIRLVGLTAVSENVVREALMINVGEFYSELKAEVNRQRIMSLGFFERVEYAQSTEGTHSILTYTVRENPRLREVVITGNRAFSDAELLAVMELKPGEVLANIQLQKDIVAVERLYQGQDYMFSKITSVERPSSANNYTLTYVIAEGEVGDIRIIGNNVTQEHVITREMDLHTGDIFNARLLREDLRSIYNLNYFSTLVPDLSLNEDTGKIDLLLKVEEKKTSSINFGGGYGQIQGWFGFVDLFLDNLMGSGQSVLLKAQFGEKLTSYQIRYYNPWMWDNKTSFTGKLWSTYGWNYLSGQRELRNGWSTSIGFRRTKNISDSVTFRYEDVFNVSDRSQDYQDRAIGYTIGYDTRDQWMNPTTGQYDVFSMDHSTKLLGGSINASRYGVQHNQFFPLAEKQVFAIRAMYDYQIGDIFPAEQYYVGSDATVRGYQAIFAKGNERSVFNFEYRYLFTEMFVGVLFYDIGQANQPVYDPLDDDRNFHNHIGWGSSIGFGINIITPMGPIRLDYGWPQYKEFADGFLSFNMGNTF